MAETMKMATTSTAICLPKRVVIEVSQPEWGIYAGMLS
jgi:hypothetical protein